ncbi:MAG: FecCD family ABC transporter permease [Bacillota bacterium]
MKLTNNRIVGLGLTLLPIIAVLGSLFVGRYPLSFMDITNILQGELLNLNADYTEMAATILLEVRLPRAILGSLVGGSLAVSGAALQGLFHNPLVDSGMLGVSAGAGLGAAVAIVYFDNLFLIYLLSFIGGSLAVFLSYSIAQLYDQASNIMLVLGGVIVSSVFGALISLLKYLADPLEELPSIIFWLMGSLAAANYRDVLIAIIPITIGCSVIIAIRWRINILSMGDREAKSLGINTKLNKLILILAATFATTGAVCVSGTINWVGLVIPHIGRILFGNDNRILIPASLSLGATFLIIIDSVSRVITGSELPLSIVTALIGGPFYVYLLKNTKGKGW